jgi:NAD(P)H-dependent FMN reductase
MTTKPRIAVVIGSTRPGRYADKAAGWILKQAQARDDIEAELLDLLDSRTSSGHQSALIAIEWLQRWSAQ